MKTNTEITHPELCTLQILSGQQKANL